MCRGCPGGCPHSGYSSATNPDAFTTGPQRAISFLIQAVYSAVVMEAGILKTDVKYDEIIDMSFVESVRSSI